MADGAPATLRAENVGQRVVIVQSPLGSVVIPAHDEAAVIGRCLDALFTGFEPGELDVVVVCNGCTDDTASAARASGHPVRVVELRARLQARRAAARGRGGEGIPAVVPGRRRSATRVGSPRRAGTSAVRGARRSAADPIRGERRVCAGAQLLPRSVAGSGRLGFALGCGRVRALGNRPEPLRPLPGRGGRRPLGRPAVRRRARWRSSTARRSWSRCRAAVAIFCASSARTYRGKREMAFAPDLRDSHLRP